MFPDVFPTLNTARIRAILGTVPRIYDFQRAPQNVVAPYVSWFTVAGQPYDNVSQRPDSDKVTVQIDMYVEQASEGRKTIRALALAVRDALDDARIVNRMVIDGVETETEFLRVSIEADFITNR